MYKIVETPEFVKSRSFDSFTKAEVKQYFEWFLNIKNERIEYLTKVIQTNNSRFNNDYSRCSIVELNKWLVENVDFRKSSQKEDSVFKEQMSKTPLLKDAITIPEFKITDSTVSMIFDVGIYFGESIVYTDPTKKWGYLVNPRSYIHYGQPIVLAQHPADNLNPRSLIENKILFSVNEKEELSNDFLVKSYDYSVLE